MIFEGRSKVLRIVNFPLPPFFSDPTTGIWHPSPLVPDGRSSEPHLRVCFEIKSWTEMSDVWQDLGSLRSGLQSSSYRTTGVPNLHVSDTWVPTPRWFHDRWCRPRLHTRGARKGWTSGSDDSDFHRDGRGPFVYFYFCFIWFWTPCDVFVMSLPSNV